MFRLVHMAGGCRLRQLVEGESLAANIAIELRKRVGEFAAANPERQTRHFFMACTNELRKNLFDDRLKQHRRAVFVQQNKLRVDPRLDGKLAQQSRTKAMNGCDDRAVERALVVEPLFTFVTLCRHKYLIKFLPESFAHLVRGAIGEGDGDYLID